jgi:hypothetical protein
MQKYFSSGDFRAVDSNHIRGTREINDIRIKKIWAEILFLLNI